MAVKSEPRYPGEFMASQAPGQRSFENITVASGSVANPGDVLGQITANKKYVPLAPGANDGSQTAAAIAFNKIDASGGDAVGVGVVRDAEVNGAEINWGTANGGQITAGIAALAVNHLIVRPGSV